MSTKLGSINSVIMKKYDGSSLSESDEVSIALNFPMWFTERIINEINEKEITVIVIRDYDNKNHIHLATEDTDLIIRVQKIFFGFVG